MWYTICRGVRAKDVIVNHIFNLLSECLVASTSYFRQVGGMWGIVMPKLNCTFLSSAPHPPQQSLSSWWWGGAVSVWDGDRPISGSNASMVCVWHSLSSWQTGPSHQSITRITFWLFGESCSLCFASHFRQVLHRPALVQLNPFRYHALINKFQDLPFK